ncbi:hypothetical protein [Halarsenatibacter silvermanii]|nr:hypothetical protein [Halarsenatibacter silvermanii]
MKLYALKSREGYLKAEREDSYRTVPMNKASVFGDRDSEELKQLKRAAENDDLANLKMVELEITEKEVEF